MVTLTDNALWSGEILLLLPSTVFVGQRRHTNLAQGSSGVRWRLRHIETMRNPSDEDSRFDAPKVRSLGIKCTVTPFKYVEGGPDREAPEVV